jgi:hypothetical protein
MFFFSFGKLNQFFMKRLFVVSWVILFFLKVEVFAQELPVDEAGRVRIDTVLETQNANLSKVVSWMFEDGSGYEIIYEDKEYGKLIFRGKYATYAREGKKGALIYSGDVDFICTILIKQDRCKITLRDFNYGSCGDLGNKFCGGDENHPDWAVWYRVKQQSKTKVFEMLDKFAYWMNADEFDF